MNPASHSRLISYAQSILARAPRPAALPGFESLSLEPEISAPEMEIRELLANHQPLSSMQAVHLEAIILPKERPVFDVQSGSFPVLPPPWEVLNRNRVVVSESIRAIGRIEIAGHPRLPYAGTGFLVGPNLLLTNRHVAALFTSGLGTQSRLAITFPAQVDLNQEAGAVKPIPLTVNRALLLHPHWDAALLQVGGVPPGIKPLRLVADAPRPNRAIAVIGYPGFDPRNNPEVQREVFRNLFEKKRLQPGYLSGMRVISSFGHPVEAITHDASTLGGNSGSAILDAETGHVLGLHFAGVYLDANFAVPSWELAQDRRLRDLGVGFIATTLAPSPPPAWLRAWDSLESPTPARAPAPAEQEFTFTVPLHITIRVGAPAGRPSGVPSPSPSLLAELEQARRTFREDPESYYPAALDERDAEAYYSGIHPNSANFLPDLTALLSNSHTRILPYRPPIHLYPLVDLHPDGDIYSIYSETRMDAEALIIEEAALEALETNSAEHVVPQSLFGHGQPMRGDLHHLFACERDCNSFRGNNAYWEFGPEEALMEDCGRVERRTNQFEPRGGKGAVARATLYFLLRYPGVTFPADRVPILLRWHHLNPPDVYEFHRNREIFRKQGNRNPFIDHPEWASAIG